MLEAYALEAQLTGRSADAADAWGEAASLFGIAGDHLGQGRCLAWLPRAFIGVGRNAEAEAASRSAIDVLEPLGRSAELARAYVAQGYVRMINRDNADGVAWGTKAATLAEELGDLDTLAYSLNTIGTSHIMAGEIELGIEFLQRSLSVARENGLWLWVGPALTMLGTGLGEMYELERSERYLREHIAFAEEHDLWPDYSRAWLALVEVYTGRWDDAVATAKTVLAGADDTISRISALIALGRVRARRGDPGASGVLDEALELARPGHHLQRLGHVHAARAEAAWLAEQPDRAASEASAAYPLALEKRHLWFAGELAYWQRRAGALHDAPEWVAEPYRLLLDGSPVAAAEAWRVRGCPYEAARALVESDMEARCSTGSPEWSGSGPGAGEGSSLEVAAARRLGPARASFDHTGQPGRADEDRAGGAGGFARVPTRPARNRGGSAATSSGASSARRPGAEPLQLGPAHRACALDVRLERAACSLVPASAYAPGLGRGGGGARGGAQSPAAGASPRVPARRCRWPPVRPVPLLERERGRAARCFARRGTPVGGPGGFCNKVRQAMQVKPS